MRVIWRLALSPKETPAEFRWRKMLYVVNEYCENRIDPSEWLTYDQIGSMVGGESVYEPEISSTGEAEFDSFGIRKHQMDQINLFKQLVEEGYIRADIGKGHAGGPPFDKARIQGLTRKGFEFISEFSKDTDEIVEKLDKIKETLEELKPEEKKKGEKIIEELKMFVRSLSYAEAQAFIKTLAETLLH